MSGPGWEMQMANEERERAAIEALNRCAAAGARPEDIKTLARECGINLNYVTLPTGTEHAKTQ